MTAASRFGSSIVGEARASNRTQESDWFDGFRSLIRALGTLGFFIVSLPAVWVLLAQMTEVVDH